MDIVWLMLLMVALGIPALGIAGVMLALVQRKAIARLEAEVSRLARRIEAEERSRAAGASRRTGA